MTRPKVKVQLKIQKPGAMVFSAVVRPEQLTRYFVQKADGALREGTTVKWKFAEVPTEFDVIVGKVAENESIDFEWPIDAASNSQVSMHFKPLDDGNTMVEISESGWEATEKGFAAACQNAAGWMHMLCCLKAYLEYDINLRAGGAF